MKKVILGIIAAAGMFSLANAEDRATMDEANAMATKAAAFVAEHGVDEAKVAFETPGGEWHDRDLYVIIEKKGEGVLLAHGVKPALVGRDMSGLKDADGKAFVMEIAAVEGEGTVDFKWQNPKTDAIEDKTSFCKQVEAVIVCVGAYKK